jgi:hypothetical protein
MIYETVSDAFRDPTFKFKREEFVHPAIIKTVGFDRCLWYVSLFQVNYAALLRETIQAPLIINSWLNRKPGPGYYVGRGTRPRSYKPKGGAELSMHYFAMAVDASSPAYNPQQLFAAIIGNEAKFKAVGLTTCEDLKDTKTWLHGDGRQRIPGIHPEIGFLIVRG